MTMFFKRPEDCRVWYRIRCVCGWLVSIRNPLYNDRDKSGKSHSHCRRCYREWHWDLTGAIYQHLMPKVKGPVPYRGSKQ